MAAKPILTRGPVEEYNIYDGSSVVHVAAVNFSMEVCFDFSWNGEKCPCPEQRNAVSFAVTIFLSGQAGGELRLFKKVSQLAS